MSETFKTTNSLMRHMRESGIQIAGSGDKKALSRIGYFHGYKGYRFSKQPGRRIPYADFSQLKAVVDFDMRTKALLYPQLMRLEMSMKNLALAVVLDEAGSSFLPDVYTRLMPGNKKGGMKKKLEVIHHNNRVLLEAYQRSSPIASHYYESAQQSVPLWALFEILTLGQFATFVEQLSDKALNEIAMGWGLRRSEGQLAPHLVFAITGLRNAVAHNGTVFDTRFATYTKTKVRHEIREHLHRVVGFPASVQLNFDTITDYFVLVVYLTCLLKSPKREIAGLVKEYSAATEDLFLRVPFSVHSMIVHQSSRMKMAQLSRWVRSQ